MRNSKIILPPEQQEKLERAIKAGILKELHRNELLTGAELSELLSSLQQADACAPEKAPL